MDEAAIRERVYQAHNGTATRFEDAQKRLAENATAGFQLTNRDAGEYIESYARLGVFSTAIGFLEDAVGDLESLRRFVFERVTMHADRGSGLDLAHRTAEHEAYLTLMRILAGKR